MRQATTPPSADADGDELLAEELIAAEIEAVQHVLVAGSGRAYLACVLSLRTQSCSAEEELDRPALQFADMYGSAARTVDEARQCARFRAGLLQRFSACNKLVCQRTRAHGLRGKPKQLRRFMIVSQSAFRQVSGGDRAQILDAFGELIASMYEVVESSVPAFPSQPQAQPSPHLHAYFMHGAGATADVTTSVCRGVVTSPASDSSVSEADGHQEGPGKIVDPAKPWTAGYGRINSSSIVLSKKAKPPFGESSDPKLVTVLPNCHRRLGKVPMYDRLQGPFVRN